MSKIRKFSPEFKSQSIQHVYIKPRTPQINGKVERSHRTDQTEFYQLLTHTNDVDLNSKLDACENFHAQDIHQPEGDVDDGSGRTDAVLRLVITSVRVMSCLPYAWVAQQRMMVN